MKKSFVFLTILLSLLLVANLSAQLIQSGSFEANYKSAGFNLNEGQGERKHNIEVRFDKPFETTPEIIVTVNYMNADSKGVDRIRYRVETRAVSRDGFVLEISTWDDSKIHGIRGDWLAYTN